MASKKNLKANEPTPQEKRHAELLEMKKNDPSHLKQDIFRLKEQIRQLYGQKVTLDKEITESKHRKMETVKLQEKQIKEQEEELMGLENRLNEVQTENQMKIKQLITQFEQEERNLQENNRREVSRRKQEIETVGQKVEYLNKYKERRARYVESITELNQRLEEMENREERDITKIHNYHSERRKKNDKETKMEMEKIKEKEVSKLEQKMSREQFIKKENGVMLTQIELCEEQIKILTNECQQLKEQMDKERLNMNDSTLGNQASETYERSLRIIKLEGKMTKLKNYLGQQSAKLEKEYAQLDNLYTKQHEEIESKVSKVEGWMRIKERDLKKMKACSQMVLNQRSNLQSYLLEVFYEHPEVDNKEPHNMNKILRFLFAKINSKKPPMTYKNFLPQSLQSMSESSFRA